MDKAVAILFIVLGYCANAQLHWVSTFENIPLGQTDTFWFGEKGDSGIATNRATFKNLLNENSTHLHGFVVANGKDSNLLGINKPYAVYGRNGVNQSSSFLLLKDSGVIVFDKRSKVHGFYLNNSSHTIYQMRKKGTEDRLRLAVYGWSNGQKTMLAEQTLAILKNSWPFSFISNWTYIDLSESMSLDSLKFVLSRDEKDGEPSYVCIDNFNSKLLKSNWRGEHFISTLELEKPYLDGSTYESGFGFEGIILENDYDAVQSTWTGFGLSKAKDTTNALIPKEFVPASPWGFGTFAVGHKRAAILFPFDNLVSFRRLEFLVNNSQFTLESMQEGTDISKKFGGSFGGDPDYLALKFRVTYIGNNHSETYTHMLADFRFDDNKNDYFLQEWDLINIPISGHISRIDFWLEGSDTTGSRLNTPAYFCLTDVNFLFSQTPKSELDNLKVFPNPATNMIEVSGSFKMERFKILNLDGKVLLSGEFLGNSIDVSNLESGVYIFKGESNGRYFRSKWIKL
jgi:hypothetical protein